MKLKKLLAVLVACALVAGLAMVTTITASAAVVVELGDFTLTGGNAPHQRGWHTNGDAENTGAVDVTVAHFMAAKYLVIEATALKGTGFQVIWQGDASWSWSGNQGDYQLADISEGNTIIFPLADLKNYDTFLTNKDVIRLFIGYWGEGSDTIADMGVTKAYLASAAPGAAAEDEGEPEVEYELITVWEYGRVEIPASWLIGGAFKADEVDIFTNGADNNANDLTIEFLQSARALIIDADIDEDKFTEAVGIVWQSDANNWGWSQGVVEPMSDIMNEDGELVFIFEEHLDNYEGFKSPSEALKLFFRGWGRTNAINAAYLEVLMEVEKLVPVGTEAPSAPAPAIPATPTPVADTTATATPTFAAVTLKLECLECGYVGNYTLSVAASATACDECGAIGLVRAGADTNVPTGVVVAVIPALAAAAVIGLARRRK